MKIIVEAQELYKLSKGNGSYGTLRQLADFQIVDSSFGSGEKTGYKFAVNISTGSYEITATPTQYGVTGVRSFYLSSKGDVRGGDKRGAAADSSDPLL